MDNITPDGWNAIGIMLGLAGILVLFKYGMPGRVGEPRDARPVGASATQEDIHYRQMGLLGLGFILVGFLIQAIVALSRA